MLHILHLAPTISSSKIFVNPLETACEKVSCCIGTMGISNMRDAYKFQRNMLEASGTWPRRNPGFFYKLRGVLNYLFVLFLALDLALACVYLKDFSELIQSWAMFVSIFNCCLKFGIFFYKIPTFLDMIEFLQESPHFTYYGQELDHNVQGAIKISNAMVRLFFGSAICTILSFAVSPLVSPKPRELPLPFPVKLYDSPFPLYVSVYFFQAFSLFLAGWTSTGFDNLAIAMMSLSAAYFKILRATITRTTDAKTLLGIHINPQQEIVEFYGKFDRIVNAKLYVCVEHHLAIIRFTEYIETIFSYVVLMQFLASGAGICLAGFTFANTPVKSYEFAFALSLLTTLMFQITLYCTFGNEVTIQSSRIGDACYMTEWIACGPVVRKTLFLIMERSKRPLVLTAGKFINLSLSSLVSVFRSAVSYGAVLKQLYHK